MAIHGHFGFTQSGKSKSVEKKLSRFDKVIVYDDASCFMMGDIFDDPSPDKVFEIFQKYKYKKTYSIIIRPSRSSDKQVLSDRAINLASALGRMIDAKKETNVQLVIDEADFVCSSNFQSDALKFIVNKGRHDHVDTHVIARNPNRIHTDIRANCSSITSFRLTNATAIPFFVSNFGRENCVLIQKLPQYWRLEWNDTGKITIFDQNNKIQNPKILKGVEIEH